MATTVDPVVPAGFSSSHSRFRHFAWGVLVYNILVVLWGAFVRATGSGAGCGSHWPLCNGVVVPRAPEAATAIEFTHRVTSGLALIGVVVLCVWAFREFARGHLVRRYAVLSVAFILVEALLGAGLVLMEYVASNASVGRAFYLSAHLVNTQVLLATLALTAWHSHPRPPAPRSWFRLGALAAMMVVGISGAIAALGDTLFPATSFAEGVRQEMSSTAHFLLRLRVLHPLFAILAGVYVSVVALGVIQARDRARLAWAVWGIVFTQLLVGGINVLLLAPVWMQIVHLALADVLWVLLVLMLL